MNPPVVVLVEKVTPRIDYVLHYLFEHLCPASYQMVLNKEEFVQHTSPFKINYSELNVSGALQIVPDGFLLERGIREFQPNFTDEKENVTLYLPNKEGEYRQSEDFFSVLFYCLSRYEEYKNDRHDKHGRYIHKHSWMHKAGVIQRPWLDEKVNRFFEELRQETGFNSFQPKYKFRPSVDLDYGYRYKGKGVVRFWGAILRDIKKLKFGEVANRFKVCLGLMSDPYDIYDDLYTYHKKKNIRLLTFVLNAKFDKYDKGLKMNGRAMKRICDIAEENGFKIGIHPSYGSHQSFEFLKKEVRGLAKRRMKKVRISRQHFLKFYLPKTFNQLLQLGIKHDYSMGYAQISGFRAGTSRPFYLYDLTEEKRRNIQLHPTAIMEGTYFDYMKVSHEEALTKMKEIADAVRNVKGELVTIWHEKQLAEKSSWKPVYYSLVEHALETAE